MRQGWVSYDKQGFAVAWCRDGDRFYWHVRHHQYGVLWGYEESERGCHTAANWAIGDMRQGL